VRACAFSQTFKFLKSCMAPPELTAKS